MLLLLPQPSSTPLPSSAIEHLSLSRSGFDLRGFIAEHGLLSYTYTHSADVKKTNPNEPEEVVKSGDAVVPQNHVDVGEAGGLAMWREVWDASVSQIYEKILGAHSF